MASYTLSEEAAADIDHIAENSSNEWGITRAKSYVVALHEAFQRLAEFPGLGREAGSISRGLLRMTNGGHVIFYRKREGGVRIIRILHERMDFLRHLQ